MFIIWEKKYETNITIIDRQHLKLVEITNQLFEALEESGGRQMIPEILQKLREYTQIHFRTEEELMERYDYVDTILHQNEHEDFIDKITEFYGKLERQEASSFELLTFLRSWITHHILEEDMQFAKYLKNKGVQ